MRVTALSIPDVLLLEPKVFYDDRGFFFESFNQLDFEKLTGLSPVFVQENYSRSIKGVLRGLHFQLPPKEQDKLIHVVKGEVFDVAVDIRKDSSTYGQWVGQVLSEKNKKQLWIPRGFAHGFLVLSEVAEVIYKTTNYYSPESQRGIIWSDPTLKVKWPIKHEPVLSAKDKLGDFFLR